MSGARARPERARAVDSAPSHPSAPLTIPDHPTLKPGLLRHLMRDAEVDPEEFRRLPNQ